MTLISSTKLAVSLNDGADARREILPGLFLNSVIAGAAYVIRQLPGMAMLSPMILSMVVEIVFHKIVGTTAWAKQGVTFSLRWLLRIAIFPLGLQLTSSQLVEIGGGGLGIIAATVRACFAFTIWIGHCWASSPSSLSSSRPERRSAAHRQSLLAIPSPIPVTKTLPTQSRV